MPLDLAAAPKTARESLGDPERAHAIVGRIQQHEAARTRRIESARLLSNLVVLRAEHSSVMQATISQHEAEVAATAEQIQLYQTRMGEQERSHAELTEQATVKLTRAKAEQATTLAELAEMRLRAEKWRTETEVLAAHARKTDAEMVGLRTRLDEGHAKSLTSSAEQDRQLAQARQEARTVRAELRAKEQDQLAQSAAHDKLAVSENDRLRAEHAVELEKQQSLAAADAKAKTEQVKHWQGILKLAQTEHQEALAGWEKQLQSEKDAMAGTHAADAQVRCNRSSITFILGHELAGKIESTP